MFQKLRRSFRFAFCGFVFCVRNERNFRIHLCCAAAAYGVGALFGLERQEYLVLTIMCALVIMLEMVNTAVEKTVDLASPDYNETAKIAKDVVAGSVLVTAAASVIVGGILFIRSDRILNAYNLIIGAPYLLIVFLLFLFLSYIFIKGNAKNGKL